MLKTVFFLTYDSVCFCNVWRFYVCAKTLTLLLSDGAEDVLAVCMSAQVLDTLASGKYSSNRAVYVFNAFSLNPC